jgi:hypothetical protein
MEFDNCSLFSNYVESIKGLTTGDDPRLTRCFWEFNTILPNWKKFQSTVNYSTFYGGREHLFYWCDGKGPMRDLPGSVLRRGSWGKQGILVSLMCELPVTLFNGDAHDGNTAALILKNPDYLSAIWSFCSSKDFNKAVRQIDKKLNVTNATLVKIPFNLEYWQGVSTKLYPIPKPFSNDPTQWLFNGNIIESTNPLHVAVVHLLGYSWPEQTNNTVNFEDCDGIMPIPSCSGAQLGVERLRSLLAIVYGDSWSNAKQDELLSQVGYAGKSLDDWLRNGFFEQHCKLFHNRPFIWHIWDGRRDGFSVLVNYHKLDKQLLEKLTYTYLGDWIGMQDEAVKSGEGGAEARLSAAKDLQDKLKLILEGEPSYDIYIRWKKPYEQPIGWEPDLNDGVRLNIRPFMVANILRRRPSIKWNKDRGRDSDVSERINDLHLTIAEKKAAREEHENR